MHLISYFTTAEITQMYFMTRNGSNICKKKLLLVPIRPRVGRIKMQDAIKIEPLQGSLK